MTQRSRKLGVGVWMLVSLWLSGCAGSLAGLERRQQAFREPAMSMQQARQTVRHGESSKADVLAMLGPATVVRFNSAYEVWVYRGVDAAVGRAAGSGAELVILFDPAGIAVKSRLRPADTSQPGKIGQAGN